MLMCKKQGCFILTNRKLLSCLFLLLLSVGLIGWWIAWRWHPYHVSEVARLAYPVSGHQSDTMLVAIIGDSWALFHEEYGCDSMLEKSLEEQYSKPVRCYSKGKSGITSKDLYENLPLDCHPDYCVVMIGINDLCYQSPPDRYVENYQLIIQELLDNNICPVVMEIPEFDIASACRYMGHRRYIKSRFLSFFTGAGWDSTDNYKRGLKKMLYQSGLINHVVYIPEIYWNSNVSGSNMFADDGFHLTQEGYHVLDSCIASEIVSYHSVVH